MKILRLHLPLEMLKVEGLIVCKPGIVKVTFFLMNSDFHCSLPLSLTQSVYRCVQLCSILHRGHTYGGDESV